MKKLWVLLLLGLSFPAGAEIVSTISYNPARMGQYDYLKVSKDAVFKGGLSVPAGGALNVNSSGTVSMRWDEANADKIYNVTTVTGGADTAVEMPNTTFRGGTLTSNAPEYYATNTPGPTTTLEVGLNGGSLFAMNKDSYVGTLNGTNYQHYTTNLNANTLNITGNGENPVGLTQEDGTSQTYGFHLAGVDIPYPAGSFVKKKGSTSLADTSRLCWVPRCTTEGNVAWVLSLVNGDSCSMRTNFSCTVSTGTSGN